MSGTSTNVADQTGAAKDDTFASVDTGLSEDQLSASLDVLPNDPGAAALYSMWQALDGLDPAAPFPLASSGLSALGASVSIGGGMVAYDAVAISALLQSMHAGESMSDSFIYTIQMANGALSTASVTVQLAGASDPASITGSGAWTVTEDLLLAVGGTLAVLDPDHDENVFQPAVSKTSQFGDFSFNNGVWSYALRNGDANVQALNAGETRQDTLVVKSLDGSAQATIVVNIAGADEGAAPPAGEPAPNPEPPAAASKTFMVNHGLSTINGRTTISGFDSDDMVRFAQNLKYAGFGLADTDQNGSLDSTVLHFFYKKDPGQAIDITLVGYTGWQDSQLVNR